MLKRKMSEGAISENVDVESAINIPRAETLERMPIQENSSDENLDDDCDIPSDFAEFLELDNEDAEYSAKLYRVIRTRRKPARHYLEEYYDEIPTLKEIGEEFGGGSYELFVHWIPSGTSQKQVKSFAFTLDRRFDHIARSMGNLPPIGGHDGVNNQGSQVSSGIEAIKEIIAAVAPLLASRSDPVQAMQSSLSMVNDVLSQSTRNIFAMQGEMMKSNLSLLSRVSGDNGEDEEDEIDDDGSAISQVVGIVKQFLPMIQSQPKPVQEAMISQAMKNEQAKFILENKARSMRFISQIKADEQLTDKQKEYVISKFVGRAPATVSDVQNTVSETTENGTDTK